MRQPSEIDFKDGTLQDGLEAHDLWVDSDGKKGKRLDLPAHFDLSGANLNGATLDGATLDDANLNGANLDGANLDGATLDGATLDGANLDGASLYRASLNGASLYRATLDGATLNGANLDGATLDGANLNGAILDGASLNTYQKWIVTWQTDGKIKIGCKTKTIAEWDAWFASNETYQTERNTADFERIEAAYQHAKRMVEIYQKYEAGE